VYSALSYRGKGLFFSSGLQGLEHLGAADEHIYNKLGIACLHQGKVFQAIDYFRKASALNPGSVEYRQNLQKAYDFRQDLNKTVREAGP